MKRYPMTPHGEKQLQEELKQLKQIERPSIIQSIAEARAQGDLKENAEYHAAREKQSFVEGRIQDIEGKLSLAQVIDISKMQNTGKIIFGSTITLRNLDTQDMITYKIVGDDEADIKDAKLSVNSPIIRSLIGKNKGEEVSITTPSGAVDYEIIDVRY